MVKSSMLSVTGAIVLMLQSTMYDAIEAFTLTPHTGRSSSRGSTYINERDPRDARRHRQPITIMGVVADYDQEELSAHRERRRNGDNTSSLAWTRTEGGYLPNLPSIHKKKSSVQEAQRSSSQGTQKQPPVKKRGDILEVTTLEEYKRVVVDEANDSLVVVRFYAPWCRSCKAVEVPFKKLARHFSPTVKFVEVPLLETNAALHAGLGVPSLPFAHIYHPEAGLVEELKMNRKKFGGLVKALQSYVEGSCEVDYESMEFSDVVDDEMLPSFS